MSLQCANIKSQTEQSRKVPEVIADFMVRALSNADGLTDLTMPVEYERTVALRVSPRHTVLPQGTYHTVVEFLALPVHSVLPSLRT